MIVFRGPHLTRPPARWSKEFTLTPGKGALASYSDATGVLYLLDRRGHPMVYHAVIANNG